MAEVFKFFNSGVGDPRTYVASDFANYLGSVLSSGILSADGVPTLQVTVDTGTLNTIVSPGKSLIKGYQYENTTPKILTHTIPEVTYDRIDRIVLRLDLRNSVRNILLHVKEGLADTVPIAPVLQRDEFIYELSLAQILVRKNTVQLLQTDLIDERLITELCGLVTWTPKVPTDQFQAQWDAFMADIVDSGFASAAELTALQGELTSHKAEDSIHLAGGTANAITVTTDANYTYGQFKQLHFKASANSTGNVTINVDGKGAVPALKFDGTQLAAGAIKAGKVYDWYYDTASGGRFFLIAKASGNAVAGDVLAGKTFSSDDGEFIGTLQKGAVIKSVQRGSLIMTATPTLVNISVIDLTKSFVKVNYGSNTDTAPYAVPSVYFNSNSQLYFSAGSVPAGTEIYIEWEVIEYLSGVKVQSGLTNLLTPTVNKLVAITSVDITKSIVFAYHTITTNASGSFVQFVRAKLISPTQLSLTRKSTSGDLGNLSWFVVEFL